MDEEFIKRVKANYDESQGLHSAAITYFINFSGLETALSCLLYEVLHIQPKSSHIPYAIYFSIEGFYARLQVVHQSLLRLIAENPILTDLEAEWLALHKKINKAREKRNAIAHGQPMGIGMPNRAQEMRWTSAAFDVLRVGDKMQKGEMPGYNAEDLRQFTKRLGMLCNAVDAVNRVVVAARETPPKALQEKLLALKAEVQGLSKS